MLKFCSKFAFFVFVLILSSSVFTVKQSQADYLVYACELSGAVGFVNARGTVDFVKMESDAKAACRNNGGIRCENAAMGDSRDNGKWVVCYRGQYPTSVNCSDDFDLSEARYFAHLGCSEASSSSGCVKVV